MASPPFHSLPVSVSRRIQCLPIAPAGTSGGKLVRRLALSAKLQSPDTSSSNHAPPPPLPPRLPPSPSMRRSIAVRLPFGGSPFSKYRPIDYSIDRVHTAPRGRLIYQLYRAMRDGDEITALEVYRRMQKNSAARQLRASDFSLLLQTVLPVNHVSITSLYWLTPRGEPVRTPQDEAGERLRSIIMRVVRFMTKIGHRPSSTDYLHLLRCASAARHPEMSNEIWDLIRRAGVSINVEHYNFFIGAHCGTTESEHWGKSDQRAIQRRTRNREDPRIVALRCIDLMSKRGVSPNSTTYELLMVAMARMGDIKGVYDTLDRIWGVNIEDKSHDFIPEHERESSIALSRHSPLYPNEDTLLAAAYALGATGEIQNAIAVVDRMSRQFGVPISFPTWYTLLNFTYAYSTGWKRNQHIKPVMVERVWEVMVSPPYNVRPTFTFYDYKIRSYLHRLMHEKAEKAMDEALEEYAELAQEHKEVGLYLMEIRKEPIQKTRRINKQVLMNMRSKHAYQRMDLLSGAYRMRRWAELLTLGKGMEKLHDMARRRIPDMVAKWKPFLDRNVVYYIDDGYVVLDLGSDDKGPKWMPGARRKPIREGLGLGHMSKETDDF